MTAGPKEVTEAEFEELAEKFGVKDEPKSEGGKVVWTDEMRQQARERELARRSALAPTEEPVAETPPEAPPEPEPDPDDEVGKLRRELDEAQARAEANDPTRNISNMLFEDTADVRRFFSHEHLVDVALDKWASENKDLVGRGRAPQPEPTGAELERRIDRTVTELLADRTATVKQRGWMLRVVKMVKSSGQLIEVPLEGQINSFRVGGADRAFAPYKAKGYKVASPYLCQAQSCWSEAVIGSDAQFTYGGYCSPDHRDRTEPGDSGSDRNIRPLYG